MRNLPSRLRRLDDALASLPMDEPMLLTELDGLLTGIVLCAEPIAPAEWLPIVWGEAEDGSSPFEDPIDTQWFTDAVLAFRDEIARNLARGKPRPILDVDGRTRELLWEYWIDGFAAGLDLRPEYWRGIAAGGDEAAKAFAALAMLVAIAREESPLDSLAINALHDTAAEDIARDIALLYRSSNQSSKTIIGQQSEPRAGAGRNTPCRCGSGRKSKHCCG